MTRILVVVMSGVSAGIVVIALAAGRRPRRIRRFLEVARIVVGAGALAAMATVTGIHTPPELIAGAAAVGLVIGVVQGRSTAVETRDGAPFGTLSPLGVAVWGLGIVGMQVAALAARTNVFRIGQAIGYLSVAVMVGLLLGRRTPRAAPATAATAGLATLVVAGALVVGVVLPAQARSDAVCDVVPASFPIVYGPDIPDYLVDLGVTVCVATDRPGEPVDFGHYIVVYGFVSASSAGQAFDGRFGMSPFTEVVDSVPGLGDAAMTFVGEGFVLEGEGGEVGFVPEGVWFLRGSFIVSIESGRLASGDPIGSAIAVARMIDDAIVALPPLSTETDPGPGTTTVPPADAQPPPTVPGAEPGTTVEVPTTEAGVAPPDSSPPRFDEGWLDGGEITSEEALVAALSAVLAAFAMGVISLAEAGSALQGLFRRSGRPDLSHQLLETMVRSGVGDFEPLEADGGAFEPIDAEPPTIYDEHGNRLQVNQGEYEDVPVGHVWWATDGAKGRWVSPEEARNLVEQARQAALQREQEAAEALARARALDDLEWERLKSRVREEAAQSWIARAEREEASRRHVERSVALGELAAQGKHDDIQAFLERNPALTPEQVDALYEAIARRTGDQEVIDSFGTKGVWRESTEATLGSIPFRIVVAIGTGGWSEAVAIPLDVLFRVRAAQEQHLREHGNLMSSGQLAATLGWEATTEAVYEAAGNLVAGGLGRVARTWWRGAGGQTAEASVRSTTRSSGGTVVARTARQADEVVAAARRADELVPVPSRGNEGLRGLEPGSRIPPDMVPQTGLAPRHVDAVSEYAQRKGIHIEARTANPHSARHIEAGTAVPKPLEVKAKTINDVDVFLGANPDHRGTVGLFNPRYPPYEELQRMSPELRQSVERRYQSRLTEYVETRTTYEAMPNTRVHDGRVQTLHDGRWKDYAGDMDLVAIRDSSGNYVTGRQYDEVVTEMRSLGLIEHGGEVRVMSDLAAPHRPGSPEWMDAMKKGSRLRETLEAAHLGGDEVIMTFTPDGSLLRGPNLDDLPWV